MYWLSATQIVVGLLIYQASQKMVPKSQSPFGFVAMAYVIGCAICLALAVAFRENTGSMWRPDGRTILCAIGMGIGTTLIEVGYFFGYRSGWGISELPILVMIATAACLAAIGVLWFEESLTLPRVAGLLLCGAGLFLLLRK